MSKEPVMPTAKGHCQPDVLTPADAPVGKPRGKRRGGASVEARLLSLVEAQKAT